MIQRCPDCDSGRVGRSHRRSVEKILLCTPVCLPFRCGECGKRFYVFENPFHPFWLKLVAGIAAFGLIILLVVNGVASFYASSPEDSVAWESNKLAASPLPKSDADHAIVGTRQESAPGTVIAQPGIEPDGLQIAGPATRVMKMAALETQDPDVTQPERKKVVLKTAAGWVRESHSADARPMYLLKKGDVVLFLGSADDWYLVQLENGEQGWVHQNLF